MSFNPLDATAGLVAAPPRAARGPARARRCRRAGEGRLQAPLALLANALGTPTLPEASHRAPAGWRSYPPAGGSALPDSTARPSFRSLPQEDVPSFRGALKLEH